MAVAGTVTTIRGNQIEDGTVTNAKLAGDILSSKLATPGEVLQVVNTIKSDTLASAGAAAWNDTGVSVAITPRSTSSKIVVNVNISAAHNSSNTWFKVLRDSTDLGLGDAGSSRLRCTFGNGYTFGDSNIMKTHSFSLLDSPSSTSAQTYKVQARSNGGTYYINRSVNDTDSVDHGRASSTITLMEVQG